MTRAQEQMEAIALIRKQAADQGISGTGDYMMWLEERLAQIVLAILGGDDDLPAQARRVFEE